MFHTEEEHITFFYDLLSVHGIEVLELFALLVTPFATQDLKNLISSFSPVIDASLAATFFTACIPNWSHRSHAESIFPLLLYEIPER